MRKFGKLHVAAMVACSGLVMGGVIVESGQVRAEESALQFLMNQARGRSRSPETRYDSRPSPVPGFFGFFGRDERVDRPQRASAAAPRDFQRVVCQRICDGSEIALGILPTKANHKDAELMCTAAGNGSPTKLIVEKFQPGTGFTPALVAKADAAPLLEGRAALDQNALPERTTAAIAGCAVSVPPEAFMVPLMHDATLRNGDVVATKEGFKVFVGGGDPPFADDDFVDVDKSKRVSAAVRKLRIATR